MTYGTINVDQVTNSDGITSGGLYGFKNRIINGAMMIDQRGSASSPVYSNVSSYAVDRMKFFGTGGGVFTSQQSAVAPTGFTNSSLLTVTTADSSIAAGDLYWFGQAIEGYNVADLGWGAAGAQTVTLSFWVRSSVTGTFSGSLNNGAYDRSYLFTYAINSANTWEQKFITVTGDTSGTWLKTNGLGMYVILDLGTGSTYTNSTSGSWLSGGYQKVTSTVNWIATSGATFYITGVQLEKGSTATSFDYRPYGVEEMLCRRYFRRIKAGNAFANFGVGRAYATTNCQIMLGNGVPMRSGPTFSYSALTDFNAAQNSGNITAMSIPQNVTDFTQFSIDVTATFTLGACCVMNANNTTNAYLDFNSEL